MIFRIFLHRQPEWVSGRSNRKYGAKKNDLIKKKGRYLFKPFVAHFFCLSILFLTMFLIAHFFSKVRNFSHLFQSKSVFDGAFLFWRTKLESPTPKHEFLLWNLKVEFWFYFFLCSFFFLKGAFLWRIYSFFFFVGLFFRPCGLSNI